MAFRAEEMNPKDMTVVICGGGNAAVSFSISYVVSALGFL